MADAGLNGLGADPEDERAECIRVIFPNVRTHIQATYLQQATSPGSSDVRGVMILDERKLTSLFSLTSG